MTSSAQATPGFSSAKSGTLALTCPFCGHKEETAWDGLYKPRYFHCSQCGEKYIYEPLADSVSFGKPGEVDCMDDPDCREFEMMGHCEQ